MPGGVVRKLPTDLRKALIAKPTALDAWKDITPLARNEFICWVEDAMQEMTRERRIRRTQEELEEGQRRPCCQLAILDIVGSRLEEARALLDEALNLSLAARSTPFVTLSLAAYARLTFAEGDPERAAMLEGAAGGLRQRVGLRAWPMLVAQVRQTLGADRFDQAFAAGSGLSQRKAVAAVRGRRGTGTRVP